MAPTEQNGIRLRPGCKRNPSSPAQTPIQPPTSSDPWCVLKKNDAEITSVTGYARSSAGVDESSVRRTPRRDRESRSQARAQRPLRPRDPSPLRVRGCGRATIVCEESALPLGARHLLLLLVHSRATELVWEFLGPSAMGSCPRGVKVPFSPERWPSEANPSLLHPQADRVDLPAMLCATDLLSRKRGVQACEGRT